jgi:PAS domain S-box-containing protein
MLKDSSIQDYETFFNNAHDLFCILNDKGYYVKINPAFHDLLGYEEVEIMSHPFTHFIHPDDVSLTNKEYSQVTKGKRNHVIENRLRNQHGEYQWISWSSIITDENGSFYSCGQNITEQKKLKALLTKKQEESGRKISRAVIQTQENERSKISLELHDNINQVLTTVKLLIEHSRDDATVFEFILDRALNLQQGVIDEIRDLAKSLSSPSLTSINFNDSVRQLINSIQDTHKININFHADGDPNINLDQFIHLALYRILQEHLANIIKHANAKNVKLIISFSKAFLTMNIQDDGLGFDTSKKSDGIGIDNMRTRAESLGGTFALHSVPEAGSTLLVSVPIGKPNIAQAR